MQYWRARSEGDRRYCACGLPLPECAFWSGVGEKLTIGRDDDEARLRSLQEEVRSRFLLRLWWRAKRGRISELPFASRLEELYHVTAQVAGAHVLVDTSKYPTVAIEASAFSGIELFVLHLQRDPRSIVNSFRSMKTSADGEVVLRPKGWLRVIFRWNVWNIAIATIVRAQVPKMNYRRISYEDFADNPRSVIDAVIDFVGFPVDHSPFIDDRRIVIHPTHDFAGNPDRMISGQRTISRRDRWVNELPRSVSIPTFLLTAPLRLILGSSARRHSNR